MQEQEPRSKSSKDWHNDASTTLSVQDTQMARLPLAPAPDTSLSFRTMCLSLWLSTLLHAKHRFVPWHFAQNFWFQNGVTEYWITP